MINRRKFIKTTGLGIVGSRVFYELSGLFTNKNKANASSVLNCKQYNDNPRLISNLDSDMSLFPISRRLFMLDMYDQTPVYEKEFDAISYLYNQSGHDDCYTHSNQLVNHYLNWKCSDYKTLRNYENECVMRLVSNHVLDANTIFSRKLDMNTIDSALTLLENQQICPENIIMHPTLWDVRIKNKPIQTYDKNNIPFDEIFRNNQILEKTGVEAKLWYYNVLLTGMCKVNEILITPSADFLGFISAYNPDYKNKEEFNNPFVINGPGKPMFSRFGCALMDSRLVVKIIIVDI